MLRSAKKWGETMPRYRWASPHEWLSHKINSIGTVSPEARKLRGILNEVIPKLDADDIQDAFQSEMDADGYFEDLDAPRFYEKSSITNNFYVCIFPGIGIFEVWDFIEFTRTEYYGPRYNEDYFRETGEQFDFEDLPPRIQEAVYKIKETIKERSIR